ncbi:MAG: RICIN domain-containing protein [Clostridium sp.]|nr:RICIN domain-containing protein [Clostridium sp.]
MKKKVFSFFMTLVMLFAFVGVMSIVKVSAVTNEEIHSKMISILYNNSGGHVTCSFDGYTTTAGRHEGIDFSNYNGAPIYSLISGKVIRVNNSSSLSTLSIYDSENNMSVIYLHSNIVVSNGSNVIQGQLIGYESNKGASAAHTHIEVRNGQQGYASKSVNDYTLDNPNPYPYWQKIFFNKPIINPGEIDPNYKTPANVTADHKINTYDQYGDIESGRYIDPGDNCYIEAVYTNGFVKVKYPTPSGDRWAYAKVSDFNMNPNKWGNPVDLGTDFYAYIINTKAWKHLTNDSVNVSMRTETGNANQVWKFERQSDNSYKIINCQDNNVLDVDSFGTTNGTNVKVCNSNDSDAQRWFIYGESGAYYLKAKCSDNVIDITGGSTEDGANVQMWEKADVAAQKFQIWKLNKAGASTLSVTAGSSYTDTKFSWTQSSDTNRYVVKIWKGKAWEGTSYKEFETTGTSCNLKLPEGTYQAYVDSCNNYSYTCSNVVTFEVVSDNTPPEISKVEITNVTPQGYTVKCNFTDDSLVTGGTVWVRIKDREGNFLDTSLVDPVEEINNEEGICSYSVKKGEYENKNVIYETCFSIYDEYGNTSQLWYQHRFDNSVSESDRYRKTIPDVILPEYGDLNRDENINVADIVSMQRYLIKKQTFTKEQFAIADMNSDNKVNVFDMVILKRRIMKG